MYTPPKETQRDPATEIINFLNNLYNGKAEPVISSLRQAHPLKDIVEVRPMTQDSIYIGDVLCRATVYVFPSKTTFLELREMSKQPTAYKVIVHLYTNGRVTERETYPIEGGDLHEVLRKVGQKAHSIEESIRKAFHNS